MKAEENDENVKERKGWRKMNDRPIWNKFNLLVTRTEFFGSPLQPVEVVQRSKGRIYIGEVGDVVSEISHRRLVDRWEPHRSDPCILQVVQFVRDSFNDRHRRNLVALLNSDESKFSFFSNKECRANVVKSTFLLQNYSLTSLVFLMSYVGSKYKSGKQFISRDSVWGSCACSCNIEF
jgi:hypothetical protein